MPSQQKRNQQDRLATEILDNVLQTSVQSLARMSIFDVLKHLQRA